MMDFFEVLHKRKSVRSFKPSSVSRDLVEKILEVAVYAPTNCNQQLWNFVVVEDTSVKECLIKEAASNTLIRRAPMLIVVSYDGWNYKEAIQGGALAVGNMLQAATYYGVGALPMNSYGSDKKVKNILGIPDNYTICCFVLLGYPDEKAELTSPVPRRNARDVTHWGSYKTQELPSYRYDPESWSRETLIAHQKFYCRKTFLGKEMDLVSDYERKLVNKELADLSGEVADLYTYDGTYIREFPEEVKLTTLDLCQETADYTEASAKLAGREILTRVISPDMNIKNATLLFKLERLPKELRKEIYNNVMGELIVIARKSNLFLSPFFWIIKIIFGPDIRKTGIYNFFGPYKPLNLSKILGELREVGFKEISWSGYFFIPPFYEQIWQMFRQYIASGGSSYLHREKRVDIISRALEYVMRLQGFIRFGSLGSVVVIRCKKA